MARLDELLHEFGVEHVRKTRGDSLSGGERRRVEIARCLATNPQFILLDEPFAGIDPIAIEEIREIILYLKQSGIGILITDHNVRETLGITDRAYIMSEGRILKSGPPAELVADADVRRLYLGERFAL
jgi:lipopolysaccharide export system ATP-binding protein